MDKHAGSLYTAIQDPAWLTHRAFPFDVARGTSCLAKFSPGFESLTVSGIVWCEIVDSLSLVGLVYSANLDYHRKRLHMICSSLTIPGQDFGNLDDFPRVTIDILTVGELDEISSLQVLTLNLEDANQCAERRSIVCDAWLCDPYDSSPYS